MGAKATLVPAPNALCSAKGVQAMGQRPLTSLALLFLLTGTTACASLAEHKAERQAFDPTACASGTFDVYFQPDQVKLSTQAKKGIEAAQRAFAGCKIRQVSVIGLPDGTDDPAKAQKVSQARADAVAAMLTSSGWPVDKLRVLARGGEDASNGKLMQRRARIAVVASAS